ncbi:hypothetical protein ASD67_19680 [Sphingopyxis sp. Root1497]|nr:hypothetical protein ASD67_19680 [Sphingopyxis sp. Root1497]
MNGDKNPHNDVLVFATQTKFGIDISAPLNSATLPQINVGYNRSEAVWMPLRPNGTKGGSQTDAEQDLLAKLNACDQRMLSIIDDNKNRQAFCLSATLPAGKYVSMASGVQTDVGGTELEIDTYSVFASFGARGGVSGSQANGGLAQIFATGIAAQRLASNPQVGQALNTQAPAAVKASADADRAAETTEQMRLAQAFVAPQLSREAELMAQIDTVWTCGDPATDKLKYTNIISAVTDGGDKGAMALEKTKTGARRALGDSSEATKKQFLDSAKTVCGG